MFGTLKRKISLINMALILLIAVIGFISASNLYELAKSIDALMSNNYRSIHALNNMLESVEGQNNAIFTYINIDKQKGLDLFVEKTSQFTKWFDLELNNITEAGEKEQVEKIEHLQQLYIQAFTGMQNLNNDFDKSKFLDFYNSAIHPEYTGLKDEIRVCLAINEEGMLTSKNKITASSFRSLNFILLMSAIAVIGGFVGSQYSIDRLLSPILSLTESIRLVKAGNLNHEINVNSSDEVGMLAQEFNNMIKRLQKYEQSTSGQLMTEKNKSLAIVKSISEPLAVLDANCNIIILNDTFENFFNVSEWKVINKHFLEAIDNEELFQFISSTLGFKEASRERVIAVNKQNEDFYFNVIVTKFRDINRHLIGLIVVFEDITHFKQLEKVKTDFIATVSHEFKTPLTSIMMGASLMLDESVGNLNAKQKDILKAIEEDGERLTTLVSDLLEITRIESGKSVFNMQPCSLISIIETSISPLYKIAESNNINLYYQADKHLPKIYADFEKITWVINNLITNALKYTRAGDEISVRAYVQDAAMQIIVQDTGIGIPEEYQEKIFDKFVQVKGYDLEVRGTGLGLYIVKWIIQSHGGDILCKSKLDEGSSFTFTLPLA